MVVKVLDVQIPVFWETIKFCIVQANEIDEAARQSYFNNLLQALLSNKSQCFIRLDEKRILMGLMITSLEMNKITLEKSLHIETLYSFQSVSNETWADEYKILGDFAKKTECRTITFDTRNEKVMELGKLVGFVEKQRSFEMALGGV